jgi:hypothetical protein
MLYGVSHNNLFFYSIDNALFLHDILYCVAWTTLVLNLFILYYLFLIILDFSDLANGFDDMSV